MKPLDMDLKVFSELKTLSKTGCLPHWLPLVACLRLRLALVIFVALWFGLRFLLLVLVVVLSALQCCSYLLIVSLFCRTVLAF